MLGHPQTGLFDRWGWISIFTLHTCSSELLSLDIHTKDSKATVKLLSSLSPQRHRLRLYLGIMLLEDELKSVCMPLMLHSAP